MQLSQKHCGKASGWWKDKQQQSHTTAEGDNEGESALAVHEVAKMEG